MSNQTATCEQIISTQDELYLRQILPKHYDPFAKQVSELVFQLSSQDAGKLSGARSSKQTPEGAHAERLALGRETVGTCSVPIPLVTAVGANTIDDSDCAGVQTKGHVYIDLQGVLKPPMRLMRLAFAKAANCGSWPLYIA